MTIEEKRSEIYKLSSFLSFETPLSALPAHNAFSVFSCQMLSHNCRLHLELEGQRADPEAQIIYRVSST